MQHLVNNCDQGQLNFGLNLRTYKNTSHFKGDAPFLYPAPKQFSPDRTLQDAVQRVAGSNFNPAKNQFLDEFGISN